jgi:hypothetical protein
MTTDERVLTEQPRKEIPKGYAGWLLFLIVMLSFNAGMCVTLGFRHGSASHESLRFMFLIVGCVGILAAVFISAVVFKQTSWIPDR